MRKKWTPHLNVTSELLQSREKRKWQIALRRYVLEGNSSPFYAPYFGLDIIKMREWFEIQFTPGLSWNNFGKKWNLSQIIPINYFDWLTEAELKLCWNFINLKVEPLISPGKMQKIDLLVAKAHFEELFRLTNIEMCKQLAQKIAAIEKDEKINSAQQQEFLQLNTAHLKTLEGYSAFEFELLNRGKNVAQVAKEAAFFKKFKN